MRHKTSLIAPSRLKEFSVPFYKVRPICDGVCVTSVHGD